MGLIETAPPPAALPLDELKAFLRVAGSEEDAAIAGFLRSATAACEAFTGLALVARAGSEIVPAPCGWRRLRVAPVRAIAGVSAMAADRTESVLAAEAYAVDIDAAGDGWVRVMQAGDAKRARVRFTAGMAADWNGVPEPIRHGIVRLAAHLYGARGAGEAPVPAMVAALWRPWRRLRAG